MKMRFAMDAQNYPLLPYTKMVSNTNLVTNLWKSTPECDWLKSITNHTITKK